MLEVDVRIILFPIQDRGKKPENIKIMQAQVTIQKILYFMTREFFDLKIIKKAKIYFFALRLYESYFKLKF